MSDLPLRFPTFLKRAEAYVASPQRVPSLLKAAAGKMGPVPGPKFAAMRQQLTLSVAMLRAWWSGEYTGLDRTTVLVLIAALLYFVVPFDVVPDFILGLGLLDDAAVLSYVFTRLSSEIEAFAAWQEDRDESAQTR